MRRALSIVVASLVALGLFAAPAFACAGLISPNGTVQLGRTTTLAAYHNGIEHYITGFSFQGAGAKFGSIVPLPARPTKIVKAGRWTLQRLELEVQPPSPVFAEAATAAAPSEKAAVVMRAQIAALNLTVLKGGGLAVGRWAKQHGFSLTPDAPGVLDFYGRRSPYFMAVEFDAKRARAVGQQQGQGTPVDIVIPTSRPWVPLRILALGAKPSTFVDADIFLLNDRSPALLPFPSHGGDEGLVLSRSEQAPTLLLRDLSSDRGMGWLPTSGMWFTYLKLHERAGALNYDLAIDPSGRGRPSLVDAGLVAPHTPLVDTSSMLGVWLGVAALMLVFLGAIATQRRRFRIAS
jgi:hypothetical protein